MFLEKEDGIKILKHDVFKNSVALYIAFWHSIGNFQFV